MLDWQKERKKHPLYQNVFPRIATSPFSPGDKVLVVDNILTNNTAPLDARLAKFPIYLSSHQPRGVIEGGSFLHNDGSVLWRNMAEMEKDKDKYLHRTYQFWEIDFWF